MAQKNLTKAAMLVITMLIIAVGSWEFYYRQKGYPVSYDDGPELWSAKRAKVYQPSGKATVFIGASRIKYDLDINTWQKLTGKDAIQLAIEGNSPLLVLEDLANDPKFKGNLIVDATEFVFFNPGPQLSDKATRNIHYFQDRTYAQKISFILNGLLESQFVFLNKDYASLGAYLDRLQISNRSGVYSIPQIPVDFNWNITADRQDKMGPIFMADTAQRNFVKAIWRSYLGMMKSAPRPKSNPMPAFFRRVNYAIEQIRARGGNVMFIRPPSSGYFWQTEQQIFRRDQLWNPLLTATHCQGIYFADYTAINHFDCPEWSHLSPQQAVVYTAELARLLPSPFAK